MNELEQKLAKALRLLKDVEKRPWYSILLSSANPTDSTKEASKLIALADCYTIFMRENPQDSYDFKLEAYAILRAAFDNVRFPRRHYLTRAHFERLLELHLDHLM